MTSDQSQPSQLSTGTLVVGGVLGLAIVGGYVALVLAGRDASAYALFVAGPAVTTVVGTILGKHVRAVEEVARTVEAQTVGIVPAAFDVVHAHLDAQTSELLAAGSQKPESAPDPASAAVPSLRPVSALPEQRAPGLGSEQPVSGKPVSRLEGPNSSG